MLMVTQKCAQEVHNTTSCQNYKLQIWQVKCFIQLFILFEMRQVLSIYHPVLVLLDQQRHAVS